MNAKHLKNEIDRRRSFAVIAHPDAGKTTLTEKFLLYGGAIHLAGHVRARKNRKNTRSDWMKMEKERGISVSSAALQFEYEGYQLNLLDTPGHEDFSEDTYRTLMAVDAAVMLLDAGKGVENQTIKLFQVCQEKKIPIVTFLNKMDMPAKDPFALMDEIEKVLGITSTPFVWPLGSGRDFQGIYDILGNCVHWYTNVKAGATRAIEEVSDIYDDRLKSKLDSDLYKNFCNSIELVKEALPSFDEELFTSGYLTPVFFGSAIKNFGLESFLQNFIKLCPPPRKIKLKDSTYLEPRSKDFSGFIFKLQANMNQKHRDRIAFMRITSGHFTRGMSVYHNRLQKNIKLSNPVTFFGQERNTIDEAFAGDIIGLSNPGVFAMGDIVSTNGKISLESVPRFAPELFSRLSTIDTSRLKAFRRAIQELGEEGVVQVFKDASGQAILGAVGNLQFETFQYRLKDEYRVDVQLEKLNYECSRWFEEKDRSLFSSYDMVLQDLEMRPVILFRSAFRLKSFQETNPKVNLWKHPPE